MSSILPPDFRPQLIETVAEGDEVYDPDTLGTFAVQTIFTDFSTGRISLKGRESWQTICERYGTSVFVKESPTLSYSVDGTTWGSTPTKKPAAPPMDYPGFPNFRKIRRHDPSQYTLVAHRDGTQKWIADHALAAHNIAEAFYAASYTFKPEGA